MTHRLTTNCAKNYCNRTIIVKDIVENVVTCFGGHGVYCQRKDLMADYHFRTINLWYDQTTIATAGILVPVWCA